MLKTFIANLEYFLRLTEFGSQLIKSSFCGIIVKGNIIICLFLNYVSTIFLHVHLHSRADLSYFDGMHSTIFAVALVPPKQNVFQPHIKHLLVLATGLNIAILGVTFKKITGADGK